jgi:hypothetical protein
MHRLILTCAFVLAACGGSEKKPADPTAEKADSEEKAATGTSTEGDAGAAPAAEGPKKEACTGVSITNLDDMLAKSDCEVPNQRPESVDNPDMKGKLEVAVSASPTKITPGGKVDLFVTFTNKTKDPLPLVFRLDPLARFETEAYDGKKKRVDMPAGQPPPPPKGHAPPPPADQKVGKVIVSPNGTARVRVPWEAVKMKWAPDKVRGTAVEKGYPRVPAGPLPKGKYKVKVVTPLIGVFEGADHEVSAPSVDIEVG